MAEEGMRVPAAGISVINRYNPTLDFRNYMIPALMVVLIIIICGFLPALNLVSEKESGTIEAMNVTPVGKLTFVLSKLIPYWVVGVLGGDPVQPRYVGAWSVDSQQVGHSSPEHFRDVRLHNDISAHGGIVHAHLLHAAVGAVPHLCGPSQIFH